MIGMSPGIRWVGIGSGNGLENMAVFGIQLGSKQKITAFNGLIPRALVFLLPSQPLSLTTPGLPSFVGVAVGAWCGCRTGTAFFDKFYGCGTEDT